MEIYNVIFFIYHYLSWRLLINEKHMTSAIEIFFKAITPVLFFSTLFLCMLYYGLVNSVKYFISFTFIKSAHPPMPNIVRAGTNCILCRKTKFVCSAWFQVFYHIAHVPASNFFLIVHPLSCSILHMLPTVETQDTLQFFKQVLKKCKSGFH